jgi:hypothetical protein
MEEALGLQGLEWLVRHLFALKFQQDNPREGWMD